LVTTRTPLRRALYRALHDPLTGLANRGLLLDQLHQALARSGRRAGSVAVFALDLDHFKLLNDSLGPAAGDEVLVEMARRLVGVLRSTDTVARLGGDEFAVLVEEVESAAAAAGLARRLREAVAAPLRLSGGQEVVVTASVGIVLVAGDGAAPEALLWNADAAVHKAKENGRDRHVLFEDGLRSHAVDRLRIETALRHALDHEGLRLHYQPLVELASGRIIGAEALVRLQDPDRGLLPPGEFLDVAEDTGLILALGGWVIAEAARQAAAWQAMADGPFTVSVNLSGRQLEHPGFLAEVGSAVTAGGADLSMFCFEITEDTLVGTSSAALRSLEELKEQGARLAIDDFGTGNSSLTWLRRLPAELLKVDGSFVAGLGDDLGATAIVRAVVSLGQALGLTTVAEGVETEGQLAELRELGCDWAQGYFFARPGPPEAIAELLGDGRRW
jgi:diguanylate cyclase (GGDEF)-like protein